ncbi:MAG TPA: sugar-binding protein [Verrucomicrobiales bacterium]|nr:sugar-binding protein [Verrucomicrobiales bacterium]
MRFPRVRPLILIAVAAAVSTAVPGCSKTRGSGNERLAFVTNGVADFWTIAEVGARKAGADLGVEVDVLMPAGGITEQKQMLEDLVTRGVDGIAVSPIDPVNQTELLNRIGEATLLITHDSDAPESKRRAYIGMDNYVAGRMCGELVREAMPDGGSVMIFVGRMEQDNARRRRQGVIDDLLGRDEDPSRFDPPGQRLEGNGYVILDTLTDQFDRAKAKANAEDTLSRHPGVGCMVGLFAYNTPAILQALEQAGRFGQVKVAAFDEDDETLQGIIDGHVHGAVVQNPYQYGYMSMEVLKGLKSGDAAAVPSSGFIDIPARQIRMDNVEEFWADLKAKVGK